MVVLAASICTASGKVLVSRQFVEVPRSRIEGLLAAFPKLIDTGSQHTVIETENIRYVYQPLGNLFLILLANRQSNILQDIETLRLCGQVVTKVCHSTDEHKILASGFELLSAFDEIVSMGLRDSVTLGQIGTTIDMESHEERIQEIISQNKEKEAKEKMKEKIKMMDEQRKRDAAGGRSGGSGGGSTSFGASASSSFRAPRPQATSENRGSYSSPAKPKIIGGGMKLGAKNKASQIISSIEPEDPSELLEDLHLSSANHESVHFNLEEKINVSMGREGNLSSLELRGELTLQVGNVENSNFKTHVDVPSIEGLQFMTNPKMDRNLFNSEGILSLKDSSRGFPVNQTIGVLKWKLNQKDSSSLPLSVNCWLSPADGYCDVDIELTLDSTDMELNNVTLSIPIPAGVEPEISDCPGSCDFQEDDGIMIWDLPTLDSESREAALHFKCSSEDQGESFFPISVSFSSSQLYTGIQISQATSTESDEVIQHSQETNFFTDEFVIS